MPSLGLMELSRQLCGKMRRRRAEVPDRAPPRGLEIHFYLLDIHQLVHFKDCHTTEELCEEAAKRCSKAVLLCVCVCVCVCISLCSCRISIVQNDLSREHLTCSVYTVWDIVFTVTYFHN